MQRKKYKEEEFMYHHKMPSMHMIFNNIKNLSIEIKISNDIVKKVRDYLHNYPLEDQVSIYSHFRLFH